MPPLPLITAQTEEKLLAFLTEHGHTKFRTQQVLDWVWRKRVTTFDAMSNLPPALKNLLAENFRFHTPEIVEIHGSADTTRKFLTKMEDGSLVESVIIPAAAAENGEKSERVTLCVSSQVGCAFGCKFCASGLLGLKRHLTTGEIIGQILSAEAIAGKRVNNIVFMGMGEPSPILTTWRMPWKSSLPTAVWNRGAPHHHLHVGIRSRPEKTGGLSQANPSGRFPARSYGRSPRPNHAGQQKMAALPAHSGP